MAKRLNTVQRWQVSDLAVQLMVDEDYEVARELLRWAASAEEVDHEEWDEHDEYEWGVENHLESAEGVWFYNLVEGYELLSLLPRRLRTRYQNSAKILLGLAV